MKDNPLILSGYRLNCCTSRHSFNSIWSWHNETMNIWTHLTGLIFLFYVLVYNILNDHPLGYNMEINEVRATKFPIFFFIFSAMICLGCSTILHVFLHQSENILRFILRLDLIGVCSLSYGGCISFLYYAL